jgi:2-succinyl-5-enolpyruvyl-6-hydroxy-3-cyclohexene-1-carboxylate synthase
MGYDLVFPLEYVEATKSLAVRKVDQFFEVFAADSVSVSTERGVKGDGCQCSQFGKNSSRMSSA